MKKHTGPEPSKKYYTALVGKKYIDIDFLEIGDNGDLKKETKKISEILDTGMEKACGLIFFTTWCPWCPISINQMKIEAKGKNIFLIGLCVDEDPEKMQDFLRRHKKYLFSTFDCVGYCGKDFEKYRVKHIPHIVILNRKGVVLRNYIVEVCKDNPDDYDIRKVFKEAISSDFDIEDLEELEGGGEGGGEEEEEEEIGILKLDKKDAIVLGKKDMKKLCGKESDSESSFIGKKLQKGSKK